ncbi:MAG: toxic anion resistance protein, partial [Candidatus Berkelbacteria bacterium]|nr:toxic anion resistance protein [Candidatus Berkelbacteria bacterium]
MTVALKTEERPSLMETQEIAPVQMEDVKVTVPEDRMIVLRSKAEETVSKITKDMTNQQLVDEVLVLGQETQLRASHILDDRLNEVLDPVKDDLYPEVAENLAELRARLEEINPSEWENKWFHHLISWLPGVKGKLRKGAITRIKAGFQTKRQNIEAVCRNLEGHRVKLGSNNSDLEAMDKELVRYIQKIKENAELGEMIVELVAQAHNSAALPDIKARWQKIRAELSIRVQDLLMAEQMYLQSRVSIQTLRDGNRIQSNNIFRTMTTGRNAMTVAMAIEKALDDQMRAIAADRETRRFIGDTIVRNARRLNQS